MSYQIDVNPLSNALQHKVDLPSGKSQVDIDYVVEWQAPTSENNYTWYRLYKSGWVEQGGIMENSDGSATLHTIILPIPMQNTGYWVSRSNYYTGSNHDPYADYVTGIREQTTTTIKIWSDSTGHTTNTMWEVKGFATQS